MAQSSFQPLTNRRGGLPPSGCCGSVRLNGSSKDHLVIAIAFNNAGGYRATTIFIIITSLRADILILKVRVEVSLQLSKYVSWQKISCLLPGPRLAPLLGWLLGIRGAVTLGHLGLAALGLASGLLLSLSFVCLLHHFRKKELPLGIRRKTGFTFRRQIFRKHDLDQFLAEDRTLVVDAKLCSLHTI